MIKYKKIYDKNGIKRFEFYPNGDTSAPGIVEFYEGKEPKLIQNSKMDVKMYYAIHALHGIDTSQENGTVAWC